MYMRNLEALNWLNRLRTTYPSAGVKSVTVHRKGFKVVFEGGELPLYKFRQKFSSVRVEPPKL